MHGGRHGLFRELVAVQPQPLVVGDLLGLLRLGAHGFAVLCCVCGALQRWRLASHKCSCAVRSLCCAVVQSGAAGCAHAQISTQTNLRLPRSTTMRRFTMLISLCAFASVLQAASVIPPALGQSILQTPRNGSAEPRRFRTKPPEPNSADRAWHLGAEHPKLIGV